MLDERRAREQDPLPLALGAGAERTVREAFAPERLQYLPSPHEVRLGGRRPPWREHSSSSREHDPERGRARGEPVGHGVAHDADTRAERAEVARSETGAEHHRRPGRGMALGTQQAQQGGFACSVRPENRPVIAGADRERHGPEQTPAIRRGDGDAVEQRRESRRGLRVSLRSPPVLRHRREVSRSQVRNWPNRMQETGRALVTWGPVTVDDDDDTGRVAHEMLGNRAHEHAREGSVTVAADNEEIGVPRLCQQHRGGVAFLHDLLHRNAGIHAEHVCDGLLEGTRGDGFGVVVDRERRDPACACRDLPSRERAQRGSRETRLLGSPLEGLERRLRTVDPDQDEVLARLHVVAHSRSC